VSDLFRASYLQGALPCKHCGGAPSLDRGRTPRDHLKLVIGCEHQRPNCVRYPIECMQPTPTLMEEYRALQYMAELLVERWNNHQKRRIPRGQQKTRP
jgi:hypothetical protein